MVGSQLSADKVKDFDMANKALTDHLEWIRERSSQFENEYREAELEAEKSLDMPKPSKKHGAAIPIYVNGEFHPYRSKGTFFIRRK